MKIFIAAILVLVSGIIIWFVFFNDRTFYNNNDNGIVSVTEEELLILPYQVTVRDRTIAFELQSTVPESQDEYVQLPYEVEIGEETRLIESGVELLPNETPIGFVERILRAQIPQQEELDMYSDQMYQYSVSFHEMDNQVVSQYPAKGGLSAFVRVMNFPDDSIGGSESRYDFIVSEDDAWILVWHGERNFCRRQGQEFWQPADQLCP